MNRYTLHIPLYLNDGTPTPEPELRLIENAVISLAGGFTATDGIGAWRGDAETYREPMRLLAVDTADDIGPELLRIAERAAVRLDQEAVYVTRQEIETYLIAPARKEIAA